MVIFFILSVVGMILCLLMNYQARKLAIKSINADIGIKIIQISDLHFDKILVSPALIIEKIYKENPEIIVITGDLCSKLKYFERVLNFLDMLAYRCECEILITLGNHDNKIFTNKECMKEEYLQALESVSKKIHVLENETFVYKNIIFGGIGDIKTNNENYLDLSLKWNEKAEKENKSLIILTHNPDIALYMKKISFMKIMLTGHTHGGQIKVPFNIEFRFLKKDILPKQKIFYGEHIYNGNKIYITSGIGCTFLPMRLKSKAEIAIFR